jgi:hypothetical protein
VRVIREIFASAQPNRIASRRDKPKGKPSRRGTMDNHPFFRLVWRFNALAVCLAILTAGAVGLADLAGDFVVSRTARPAPEPVAPSGKDARLTAFALGNFIQLKGTPFMYAHVSPAGGARSGRSSLEKSGGLTRNIVIYDARDGSARNLLTNDQQTVVDVKPLPASSADGRPHDVEALMLEVAHGDTDADPPTFQNSRIDMILFSPDGMRRLDVVRGARSADRVDGPGDGRVFVFARESDGVMRAYDVDFHSFALVPKGEVKRPDPAAN